MLEMKALWCKNSVFWCLDNIFTFLHFYKKKENNLNFIRKPLRCLRNRQKGKIKILINLSCPPLRSCAAVVGKSEELQKALFSGGFDLMFVVY